MTQPMEHDWPPTMRVRRGRRRRREIIEPDDPPASRIHRVEVTVHHRRPHSAPPWLIALLIIAAVMWISPFGAVVAIVMGAILITSHPMIGIVLGGTIALVVIIALRERWAGRPF
jgi:hypothetical protein